jgi:hypothetical protein
MNRKSITYNLVKGLSLFLIAILVAVLGTGIWTVQTVHAVANHSVAYHSDLAIKQVSGPKSAKACETFKADYVVTNLGPDSASNVSVWINVPDALEVQEIQGAPANLKAGESTTVTAVIKVVAFVPDESRKWQFWGHVSSEIYPDTNIDSNSGNDDAFSPITLIGRHAQACP